VFILSLPDKDTDDTYLYYNTSFPKKFSDYREIFYFFVI